MPDDPRPNQPASGTYGEAAEREQLARSLPGTGQGTAPGPGPEEPPGPGRRIPREREGRPAGPTPPPGIPPVLLHPGSGFDGAPPAVVPQGPTAPAPVVNAAQRRIAVLDAIANHPEVSEETREWAQVLLDVLLEGE